MSRLIILPPPPKEDPIKKKLPINLRVLEIPLNLNLERGKILIIDKGLVEKSAEGILSSEGFDVRSAEGDEKALELLKSWEPQVVVLCLPTPAHGILELCEKFKRMKPVSLPSCVVISDESEREEVSKLLEECAGDFIMRPVRREELLRKVRAQVRLKEFHRELEEDKRSLETILAVTGALSATQEPGKVLETIVEKVADFTGAVRCSIVLVAEENAGYVLATNDDPNVRDLKIDLLRYPEIREAVERKSPVVIEDMANHPLMEGVREYIKGLAGMSVLIVPIVFEDEVLGTLFLRTRKSGGGFSQKEVDFCRIIANSSYNAIKNARLFEKVAREKNYFKEVAIKDHLTNLYNHNYFYTRLEEEFERAVRYKTPLSVIMMDIDDFKRVNDSYGHRVGDTVLKDIAEIIKKGVRKSDVVARYGGEEFAIILPHTPPQGAVEEAERLRKLTEAHTYGNPVKGMITMSFGVASYPDKTILEPGDLVNKADDALYRAKWSGKNCVRIPEEGA